MNAVVVTVILPGRRAFYVDARTARSEAGRIIEANDSATFTANTFGTVNGISATGSPTPTILAAGSLPSGVGVVDHGDGTASLEGTPAPGSEGTYQVAIGADVNGVGYGDEKSFTLTVLPAVQSAPVFVTPSKETWELGNDFDNVGAGTPPSYTFETQSSAWPVPHLSVSGLPSQFQFTDNVDGTGTVTPTDNLAPGTYSFSLTASNGVAPDATQQFVLTVLTEPTIDNGCSGLARNGIVVDAGFSFPPCTISVSGSPTPTITTSGWPTGLNVVQSGTTITVTGVPLESGSFPITLRASNDVGPGFDADFTMYVGNALEIYQVTPTAGIQYHGMLTEILTAGLPTPTISEQGEIPPGLTFTDLRNGVAILSGTPIAAGPYPVTFVVHNGVSPDSSWDADFFINPQSLQASDDGICLRELRCYINLRVGIYQDRINLVSERQNKHPLMEPDTEHRTRLVSQRQHRN
jgi:large repetitive protein